MHELVWEFTNTVEDERGRSFSARVLTERAADGMWEGSISFVPQDGGPTLWTLRETRQPEREDVEYWASGLTYAFLEGALTRAEEAPHGLHD
jgi:hypothetical protein